MSENNKKHGANNVKSAGISMFPVAPPFDVAYRNEKAPYPVGPHSHNAAELYFTLTDLPDVLINDTVSAVPAGTLLILPASYDALPCRVHLHHRYGCLFLVKLPWRL